MISLLPLLLLPSIQGQTCDMAGLEERMDSMEERVEEMVEERVKGRVEKMLEERVDERLTRRVEEMLDGKVQERLEERLTWMEERIQERVEERVAKMEEKLEERVEEVKWLRDLTYLTLCAYQGSWTSADSTITLESPRHLQHRRRHPRCPWIPQPGKCPPACAAQTHLTLTDAAPTAGRHARAQD